MWYPKRFSMSSKPYLCCCWFMLCFTISKTASPTPPRCCPARRNSVRSSARWPEQSHNAGFPAAAAALFSAGYLAPATLVAVFLATSDEAVPVMLAGGASVPQVVLLLAVKFGIAVIGGYILRLPYSVPTARKAAKRWRSK